MVINEKVSNIKKIFVLQDTFFWLKFVGTVFVGNVYLISSHVITELSIILPKYLSF